jgi:predicted DNA-binding transcriptional regulator YafY
MLIGWCELRRDFRSFRADRVKRATFLDGRYPERPAVLRAKWFASWRDKTAAPKVRRSEKRAAAR